MVVRVTMLCVSLWILTINAASLHFYQMQASHHEIANGHFHHPALPKKLMFDNKIEGYKAAMDLVSSNGKNKASKGESYKEEVKVKVMVRAAKGTRQEWIEGSDQSHEFFTMDYSHVRRRRPIHNKSLRKSVISSP